MDELPTAALGSRADLRGVAVRSRHLLRGEGRPICARRLRDEALKPEIDRVHAENRRVYGADKVWTQLNREGTPVDRCTHTVMTRPIPRRL